MAQLLASEGFATIEDVAYVDLGELAQIEAFDEETAQELQNRAIEIIEARNKELDDKRLALGVDRRCAGSRRHHARHGGGAGRA